MAQGGRESLQEVNKKQAAGGHQYIKTGNIFGEVGKMEGYLEGGG